MPVFGPPAPQVFWNGGAAHHIGTNHLGPSDSAPDPGRPALGYRVIVESGEHAKDLVHHWNFKGIWAGDRHGSAQAWGSGRRYGSEPDQLDDLAKAYGEHVLTYALDVTDSAGSEPLRPSSGRR